MQWNAFQAKCWVFVSVNLILNSSAIWGSIKYNFVILLQMDEMWMKIEDMIFCCNKTLFKQSDKFFDIFVNRFFYIWNRVVRKCTKYMFSNKSNLQHVIFGIKIQEPAISNIHTVQPLILEDTLSWQGTFKGPQPYLISAWTFETQGNCRMSRLVLARSQETNPKTCDGNLDCVFE